MHPRLTRLIPSVLNGDLFLVALIASILAMMVVPVPPWVLDAAISANLCVSFLVLMTALRAPGPAGFPTFPSLLLLTTLVRLSLNISSTRMILTDGTGGRVIEAFGRFVAGGDFVVGGIVFAVITVIQFMVIAKGSERVAEVAARFNLDAMPGKQMSIDAELRAGAIDQAEAQRRRQALEQESQFHGAMDGAMKFVKGDAIAGIIIAAVNVAGGFVIGVLQHGMDAGDAAATYAVLSIGDGLVSQIPSLLISIAAGILVTRVRAAGGRGGLGADVAEHLVRSAWALYSTAGFLLLLAAAPGIPAIPFVALAAAAAAGGSLRSRRTGGPPTEDGGTAAAKAPTVQIPGVVSLEIGTAIVARDALAVSLAERVDAVRASIRERYGVRVPGIRIVLVEGSPQASVKIRGVTVDSLEPPAGEEGLAQIAQRLEAALEARLPGFVGVQDAHDLVEELVGLCPALVRETVPRVLGYPRLVELLRRLLEERIPISDLKAILESVAGLPPGEGLPVIVESVRTAMRLHICAAARGGRPALPVLLVDRSIERAITDSVAEAGGHQCLAIHPDTARAIIGQVRDGVARTREGGGSPALVTEQSCRRFLRKIIEAELPEIHVIAYHELAPEVRVEAVGRVALAA